MCSPEAVAVVAQAAAQAAVAVAVAAAKAKAKSHVAEPPIAAASLEASSSAAVSL
ncbi:MAG: hypothetical protein ACJAYU_000891 [Bradymonadia bacterium]|jgi:hypothetical protein